VNPKSGGTELSAEEQLKKQSEKLINIKPVEENEPPHEKMKRRKALECCGSYGR
jgi:hypothetical protein